MLRIVFRLPALCWLLAVLWGTPASPSHADTPDYERFIKPLIKQRCLACHGALKSESGLRLDTVAAMQKGGQLGPAVEPGKSANSLLIQAITGQDGVPRMPPAGQAEALTAEQIDRFKAWIDAGAPHPANEQPEPDPRQHWAFQKPVRPSFPAVSDTTEAQQSTRNPIDLFIGSTQQKHGVSAMPPADRATLLRRVTIDLIGLPPSRDELQAFLADNRPDAYERVVERLLQSPQYGERWARHWMDVWRYSDWYGRRNVPDWWNSASQIWRWRDWIVASLNTDKGYDRMVMEMLAADEIAPGDDQAAVATGYLARNWYALNYNQWMRDNVEHTAKAFLGLTFHCAHCHDHKYDPISQEDYFRFRAFFEPLELRQDRLPGEPDPGPFQKYSYSVLRKVVRSGNLRVFDERLSAPTHFYSGGDERNRIEGKAPVLPGLPAALCSDLKIEPVQLPPDVAYPGLRTFIRTEERTQRENAVQTAKQAPLSAQTKAADEHLAEHIQERSLIRLELDAVRQAAPDQTVEAAISDRLKLEQDKIDELEILVGLAERQLAAAQFELAALEARIAADDAKFINPGPQTESLARAASLAEKQIAAALADVNVFQARQKLWSARRLPATDKSAATAVATAEQGVDQARKALETALANLKAESSTYQPLSPHYPATSTGRRKALALWITSRDNPLTARVAVNHIWLRHFGTPLVESVFDFGRNGKLPTHPELLDWLAAELMESGWSQKHLHRLIVTSATYRQASAVASQNPNLKIDPDNRWLWRFPRRRIESEVVHDGLLAIAGDLDLRMGGQEVENDQADKSRRRTVYFSVHPEDGGRMKFLENFDAPDPVDCYRRTENVIPQQALALTNSPFAREVSSRLALRLLVANRMENATELGLPQRAQLIQVAFEQVLSRVPTTQESERCLEFWKTQRTLIQTETPPVGNQSQPAPNADRKAFESLLHALLNHHEFVTIR